MFSKPFPRVPLLARLALVGALTTVAASAQPGVAPQMTVDREDISVRAGGWQRFHLHAGSHQAGGWYVILGSMSGTGPGIRVYDFTIPLNYDIYTEFTLTRPNAGFLLNQVGRLDADGNAKAGFFLPAGLARDFVGLEIHHAFVLDGVDGTIRASNPVPLLLTD